MLKATLSQKIREKDSVDINIKNFEKNPLKEVIQQSSIP